MVCVSVSSLTATAVNVRVESKVRIESECGTEGFRLVDIAKNTLFKSYGVIYTPPTNLDSFDGQYIHQKIF